MAILVLNTIGGIVLAYFMYSFITDPSSSFNRSLAIRIQTVVGQFKPLDGIKGDKGDKGDRGDNGESIVGPKGDSIVGPRGQDGVSVKGDTGERGDIGPTGPAGAQSPQASFRCDPDTEQIQYKYPQDEDWTNIGAVCEPIGDNNAVR